PRRLRGSCPAVYTGRGTVMQRHIKTSLCLQVRHGADRSGLTSRSIHAILAEAIFDEVDERLEGLRAFRSFGLEVERCARACRKHHQPHDGRAAHRVAVPSHRNLGIERFGALDELRRRACVQPLSVADGHESGGCATVVFGHVSHGSPESTCLATLMYLRPASLARSTALASGVLLRTLASRTSIGRFTPAMTSTLASSRIEMERLDGVPPNMSVSSITPSPVSSLRAASRISCRRASTSSSGPIDIVSICCCGPTTCSSAARNSRANSPWVTIKSPIIALVQFRAGWWPSVGQPVRACP